MKSFEKILCALLETLVIFEVETTFVDFECREHIAPVGIASKGNDDIELTAVPEILQSVVLHAVNSVVIFIRHAASGINGRNTHVFRTGAGCSAEVTLSSVAIPKICGSKTNHLFLRSSVDQRSEASI